ncbi:MAG TPA: ABC transporter permease [Chloroflexota bacterium]|nr:ABC transporter permease [Chloroflexota bacterium]
MLIRLRSQVLQAVATLFGFMLVIFVATRASGNPVYLMLPVDASQRQVDALTHQLGLDKSYPEQLGIFLKDLLTLNFGRSLNSQEPVMQLLIRRLGPSLQLDGVSLLLVIAVALPLGVLAATQRNKPVDYLARFVAAAGQTVPPFWLGVVLVDILAVQLNLLPASGESDWKSFIMPAVIQGMFIASGVIRLLRSAMLENLDTEFVKLARAKGISERRIVWLHVMRNSLIPVLTFGSLFVSLFVGGSVVTETVFNWPGIGQITYQAIARHDYPVIQGVVVLVCLAVVATNLLLDALYAVIDPRIRPS